MESCVFCKASPTYVCLCRRPAVLLCSVHKSSHIKQLNYLDHNFFDYPLKTNTDAKNIILTKLEELDRKSKECIQKLEQDTNKLVEELQMNLGYIIGNISKLKDNKVLQFYSFIEEIDLIKKCIRNINELEIKDYYPPFERALLSIDSAKALCSQISLPYLKTNQPDFNDIFDLTPSNLTSILTSYNFAVNLSGDHIKFQFPNDDPSMIPINNYTSDLNSSRCLKVTENSIIITGGHQSLEFAYELSLTDYSIEYLPFLREKRMMHAMAWIDGKPAVLGGHNGSNRLTNTVEKLEGNTWVIIKPMNYKREGITACNSFDKVFVVGKNPIFEVYYEGEWHDLKVNDWNPLYNIPMIYCNSNLILLLGESGGVVTIYKNTNTNDYHAQWKLNGGESLKFNSQTNGFFNNEVYSLLCSDDNPINYSLRLY